MGYWYINAGLCLILLAGILGSALKVEKILLMVVKMIFLKGQIFCCFVEALNCWGYGPTDRPV